MKRKGISKVNEKAIEEYMIHDRAGITNPNTLRNHKAYLRMFLNSDDGIGKDYNKITQQELDLFFGDDRYKATSREVIKPMVKKFFKFHKIENLEIQTNGRLLSKPTKGEESVLTADEIEALIEAPVDLRDQALIETFVVTGARKEEIRMLNLGDIKINPDLVWINIRESKTKVRRIPIAENPDNPVARYPEYLIDWVRQRRKKENPNAPLFYSRNHKSKGERMGGTGFYEIIYALKKKVDLKGKKLTPHIFRHTGATYDGAVLPEQMLCQKYGWVLGSNMVKKYCHFNEKQLAEQILKHAGLKPDEAKGGKVCPRCGDINNIFAKECSKCHQILDPEKLMELMQKEETEVDDLKKEMAEMKTMIKMLQSDWYKQRKDGYEHNVGISPEDVELIKEFKSELKTLREIKEIGLEAWSKKQLNKE